jgi:hypothetical protein
LYKSKFYQEAWLTLLGLQTADPASMDEELGKPVILKAVFPENSKN